MGTASARDILGQVGEPGGLLYTTIAKVLDCLHDKGLVSRERRGVAALVELVESLDLQLLGDLEKAMASRQRSHHGE